MKLAITSFKGEYNWLSNFHPVQIEFEGEIYKSVEAAYVAAKTTDTDIRAAVRSLETPGRCKRFGRTFPVRRDWEKIKANVMRDLVRRKFCNPILRAKLILTGSAELIEGNNHGDRFWGVCDGKGMNHLGQILMEIREEVQKS